MKIMFLKCKKPIEKEIIKKYKNIQIIDSRNLAGEEHLKYAILHAKKAFRRGKNISNNLLVEVVVRASCQRQIRKALQIFGIRENSREVAVFGDRIPIEIFSVYKCNKTKPSLNKEKIEKIKKVFKITDEEIRATRKRENDAIIEIIKERIALIEIE